MKHKIKDFKYLSISDIHLGHNTNKTENIVNNLNLFIKDYYKDITKLDAIFINGDLFDKLLSNTSNDYIVASKWFASFVIFCSTHNIKIRVLEGTPSHDWSQFKLIMKIIEKLEINIDIKYIDTLHIEYMEEFNINVLYVPDEYRHDANETYEEVLSLLKEKNISKVQIAMMHGAFKYQLPIELKSSHVEEYYLNIVEYFISIGHIHTPSVYSRIIANGSFDRIAHSEEEDKGAMMFHISNEYQEYKFLKNKNSMIFNTYRYKDVDDLEFIISDVDSKIKKLPYKSSVKIIVEDTIYLNKSFRTLEKKYKDYKIKIEGFKYDKTLIVKDKLVYDDNIIESFQITSENIVGLMSVEMNKYNLSSKDFDIFENELNSILKTI